MAKTKKTARQLQEERVDEASKESFPASDPPAYSAIVRHGPPVRHKKSDHK